MRTRSHTAIGYGQGAGRGRRREARTVKITTIGGGNIGGGLARLWERAGHQVATLGRVGGSAADADVEALEDFVPGVLGNAGQVFYRFAPPGEL